MIYDCAVIGAGPAGIIASIQLKRAGLNTILFEKNKVGGLLWNAKRIENYLGFEGITGPDLISIFSKQLNSFNPMIVGNQVISINKKNDIFITKTTEEEYHSRTVIVATGTLPKKTGIPGEDQINNDKPKLFYNICDIPNNFHTNNIDNKEDNDNSDDSNSKCTAIIIGGGDVGFDYAINLHAKGCNPLIITKNKISCLKLLQQRADQLKINYFKNMTPISIQKTGSQIQVVCKEKQFKGDFILVSVGRKPQHPSLNAKEKGLFLAGDVQNKQYRQVQISAGDGLSAAMKVKDYLNQIKIK